MQFCTALPNMKPSYCSGGTIMTGRLSDFKNISTISRKNSNNVKNQGEIKSVNAQSRSVARRQQQHKEPNNNFNSSNFCSPATATTTTTARPSSPFIVYRSAKYVSPHARFFKTARGYAKYYIVIPAALLANRCKHVFYQLCGLLLLIVASPLWMLLLLGLFVVRRLRLFLIQRLHPGLIPIDDCNIRSVGEANESVGVDIVNSLVWTRGKLDAETIRKRFKLLFTENQHLQHLLRLKLTSKYGVTLWEANDSLSLENHIVEAPKMFHSWPVVDEPLKDLYRTGSNKSILQKYISHCASLPLDSAAPPWKIHVVSYISREEGIKEKTCLVIRMHVALIKNRNVRNALRELFVDSPFADESIVISPLNKSGSLSSAGVSCDSEAVICYGEITNDESVKMNAQNTSWNVGSLFCFGDKIKEISLNHRKNLRVWINLRLKQLEFHSKPFVMKIILVDIKDAIKRCADNLEVVFCEIYASIICCLRCVMEIIQALAAIPMIILASLLRRTQFRRLGLQKSTNGTKRLISWSDLLHGDLIEEICKQTGTTSSGNVIMMACSYALSDYFKQNNIPDPETIGFTVGNAMNCTSSMSLKAIRVPCNVSRYPMKTLQELQIMKDVVENYPSWKILGLWYTFRFSSYFMPTCLAQKVQRRIVSCYPFSFSHVNMNSVDSFLSCQEPIHQVYGEIVEEFSFWQLPPLSDFGISITLVQYSGRTRLFVMSPFQSMDTILTQRCNQYLIKIAEDVGVERNKIPYSRRSSPSSTSCSTPQNPPYIFNNSEKCSFEL